MDKQVSILRTCNLYAHAAGADMHVELWNPQRLLPRLRPLPIV